ncbi:MAG: hypothetical protein P0Y65_08920 [Candidatus Devosia phytovorans]|uniref:Uncharacterized protein n=1 Tax=Candidatus Devosia phytovorans TaxID=3121372 RepID=A0AAJ6B1K1_9HYPH|nr:hypothetical protein [Devosia sp.]WEK06352.1 MAG: hypothetical protein P0Y65_08920 [Devosia sp.]
MVVWLVFSVLKKVIGFVFLLGVIGGGIYLWYNPAMLHNITVYITRLVGGWS